MHYIIILYEYINIYNWLIIRIYYYLRRLSIQGSERVIYCTSLKGILLLHQSKEARPTIPTNRKKEEKRKRDSEGSEQLKQTKKHWLSALDTRQSNTIEYRVDKIVPQRR